MIYLRIAQRWLDKLEYEYKNIHKDIFINKYEQLDINKDCKVFIKKMKELKSYIMEFNKNDAMKLKIYPSNCIVKGNNW